MTEFSSHVNGYLGKCVDKESKAEAGDTGRKRAIIKYGDFLVSGFTRIDFRASRNSCVNRIIFIAISNFFIIVVSSLPQFQKASYNH